MALLQLSRTLREVRVRQLAERYATPLPQLTGEVATLADVLRELKKASSAWVHENIGLRSFAWQECYAAFTVSATAAPQFRGCRSCLTRPPASGWHPSGMAIAEVLSDMDAELAAFFWERLVPLGGVDTGTAAWHFVSERQHWVALKSMVMSAVTNRH